MNNFRLRYLLLTLVMPLFLMSCGDDDDDDPQPQVSQNINLLTAGVWTGNAVYVAGQDRTAEFEEQFEINLEEYTTTFDADGTYNESYQGTTLIDGTWKFTDNERTIVFDEGTDDTYSVSVTRLDEDELFYMQDGVEYRFIR